MSLWLFAALAQQTAALTSPAASTAPHVADTYHVGVDYGFGRPSVFTDAGDEIVAAPAAALDDASEGTVAHVYRVRRAPQPIIDAAADWAPEPVPSMVPHVAGTYEVRVDYGLGRPVLFTEHDALPVLAPTIVDDDPGTQFRAPALQDYWVFDPNFLDGGSDLLVGTPLDAGADPVDPVGTFRGEVRRQQPPTDEGDVLPITPPEPEPSTVPHVASTVHVPVDYGFGRPQLFLEHDALPSGAAPTIIDDDPGTQFRMPVLEDYWVFDPNFLDAGSDLLVGTPLDAGADPAHPVGVFRGEVRRQQPPVDQGDVIVPRPIAAPLDDHVVGHRRASVRLTQPPTDAGDVVVVQLPIAAELTEQVITFTRPAVRLTQPPTEEGSVVVPVPGAVRPCAVDHSGPLVLAADRSGPSHAADDASGPLVHAPRPLTVECS